MKKLFFLVILAGSLMVSCTKSSMDDFEIIKTNISEDGGSGTSNPSGLWQRYGSPKGYQTDLAIGGISGEPSNRVYMCEHPGSPSAGLYKGFIYGNIITWDAVYHLPNAEFAVMNGAMSLYFGVGLRTDAGKYKKGIWTNTCGTI